MEILWDMYWILALDLSACSLDNHLITLRIASHQIFATCQCWWLPAVAITIQI